VDGLILVGNVITPKDKCDTVLISTSHHQGTGASSVSLDAYTGISACLDALTAAGHRRIGYIGEAYTASRRERLMKQIAARGLAADEELFYTSRHRFADAGRDGVAHLLSLPEPPTAILGAYGYITQGILEELSGRGLRVPEDISIISMDNDPSPIHPQLDVACIPSDTERICAGAMQILREKLGISAPNDNPIRITLDATFHEGETIGKG
jgi:LacI family transcriptional regulator